MLTAQQQVFVQALEEQNLEQIQSLLAEGLNPNFIDFDKGPAISVCLMACLNGGKGCVKLLKLARHYQRSKSRNVWLCIWIF